MLILLVCVIGSCLVVGLLNMCVVVCVSVCNGCVIVCVNRIVRMIVSRFDMSIILMICLFSMLVGVSMLVSGWFIFSMMKWLFLLCLNGVWMNVNIWLGVVLGCVRLLSVMFMCLLLNSVCVMVK